MVHFFVFEINFLKRGSQGQNIPWCFRGLSWYFEKTKEKKDRDMGSDSDLICQKLRRHLSFFSLVFVFPWCFSCCGFSLVFFEFFFLCAPPKTK